MTEDDIGEVTEAFGRAAVRACEAGFDYIELMAGGGYLIGEFLSPVVNKRTDRYGGPIENRMQFGLEVIRKVRDVLGKDCAMGIRVSGHDYMEGGHTNRESAIFCVEAEKGGVDCINVTGGWHETNVPQITSAVPPGAYLHLARGIKEKVVVPVFASNRLVAVAVPPGSTPAGGENADAESAKVCAAAIGTWAAANKDSNSAKTMARMTCLKFNMCGWKLTTFDSSYARPGSLGGETWRASSRHACS